MIFINYFLLLKTIKIKSSLIYKILILSRISKIKLITLKTVFLIYPNMPKLKYHQFAHFGVE